MLFLFLPSLCFPRRMKWTILLRYHRWVRSRARCACPMHGSLAASRSRSPRGERVDVAVIMRRSRLGSLPLSYNRRPLRWTPGTRPAKRLGSVLPVERSWATSWAHNLLLFLDVICTLAELLFPDAGRKGKVSNFGAVTRRSDRRTPDVRADRACFSFPCYPRPLPRYRSSRYRNRRE